MLHQYQRKNKLNLSSENGLTLVEIMLVIVILGIITAPIYNLLVNGWSLQTKAFNQSDMQDDVRSAMLKINDGFTYNSEKIGGLRSASEISFEEPNYEAIAYHYDDKIVTYFLDNSTLNRSVHPYQGQTIINKDDASVVLSNVSMFKAEPNSDNTLVTLKLETNINEGKSTSGQAKLQTKIKIRNTF